MENARSIDPDNIDLDNLRDRLHTGDTDGVRHDLEQLTDDELFNLHFSWIETVEEWEESVDEKHDELYYDQIFHLINAIRRRDRRNL